MIQFLNIAGTGPIFGAIMGAWYGPVAYLWIVFGCIFAGAVHDYLSGMLSMRHGGVGLPELVGKYLGNTTKNVVDSCNICLLYHRHLTSYRQDYRQDLSHLCILAPLHGVCFADRLLREVARHS